MCPKPSFLDLMKLDDAEKVFTEYVKPLFDSSTSGITFKGKTFVVGAGKMKSFSRVDVENHIKDRQGIVRNTVTNGVDYFVCPDEPDKTASKYVAAIEKGTTIINETELCKALNL